MPTVQPHLQEQFARSVLTTLREAGYQALWAGGCVRDRLCGLVPADYDVATDARPEQVRQLFTGRKTVAVGAAFGVITVVGGRGQGQVEVATFRGEAEYSDGRHPDRVWYSTAEEDAQRRDFTINGMFYDPLLDQVIDYVAGQDDLAQRRVRAIGDPHLRFQEDKLRMLRGVRFAATFGFEFDDQTLAATQAMAAEILRVSPERIAQEMRRMLVLPGRGRAAELLRQTGLLEQVLPEALAPGNRDPADRLATWWWRVSVLSALAKPTFPLALAALLCLPPTGIDSAAGEPGATPGGPPQQLPDTSNLTAVAQRWRLSNQETDHAQWLITHLHVIEAAADSPWPTVQRVLREPGAEDLLDLATARLREQPGLGRHLDFCKATLAAPRRTWDPAPLITGNDLLDLGIPAGKHFQELLAAVRDAQLEGRIDSREAGRELAYALWQSR